MSDLIGHSLEGGMAMRVLAEQPDRVQRLALLAPCGLGLEVALPLRLELLPEILRFLKEPQAAPSVRRGVRSPRALEAAWPRRLLPVGRKVAGAA
ncbi:hypothetical protein ACMHYB_30120 [Sorangium sp. So ce1128]